MIIAPIIAAAIVIAAIAISRARPRYKGRVDPDYIMRLHRDRRRDRQPTRPKLRDLIAPE